MTSITRLLGSGEILLSYAAIFTLHALSLAFGDFALVDKPPEFQEIVDAKC